MCVAIRIFRNSLRSPPWSHHGTCPLLPTSPRYFATFDFIRPVRAVTVNFMDRSRSRQAHQEVGRSGVENEDEPRRSSSVFQFSLFFLNRRNGKSRLRSFFLFRASRKKRLASVVVIHRFFTVEFCLIVHRLPGS